VAVEFVSHILDLNHFDEKVHEVTAWVEMMEGWKQAGGWMPDGQASCGNHIHISKSGTDDGSAGFTGTVQARAYKHITAMYAAFDWNNVADGGCGRVRSYNHKPQQTGNQGSWLSDRGYGTMEHRLWNTPAEPQRLWAHVGLSLALTRWAFALSIHRPEFTFWTTHNQWGDGSMNDEMFFALNRNIARVRDSIAQYIPDRPEFTIAHDVLGTLAPLT
jgi:hypothetical protein